MNQFGSLVLSCAICKAESGGLQVRPGIPPKWRLPHWVENPAGLPPPFSTSRSTSTAWPSLSVTSPSEMNLQNESRFVCKIAIFILCPLMLIESNKSYTLNQLQCSLVEPFQRTQSKSLARQLIYPQKLSLWYCRFSHFVSLCTAPTRSTTSVLQFRQGLWSCTDLDLACRS